MDSLSASRSVAVAAISDESPDDDDNDEDSVSDSPTESDTQRPVARLNTNCCPLLTRSDDEEDADDDAATVVRAIRKCSAVHAIA